MGKIVLTELTSIDGVVEAPGGEDFRYEKWSSEFDRGPDGERYEEAESLRAAALLTVLRPGGPAISVVGKVVVTVDPSAAGRDGDRR